MQIEIRTFANFREAIGQKVIERDYDREEISTEEVLNDLVAEYPDLDFFDEEGNLLPFLNIMKNGRDVTLLDDLETALEDGDRLSLFPPVAGGSATTTVKRSYRGISMRAAIQYLVGLGGERVDESTVTGSGWHASLSAEKISIGPSLSLTEVTVCFSGDPQSLHSLVESFTQKALRAGG